VPTHVIPFVNGLYCERFHKIDKVCFQIQVTWPTYYCAKRIKIRFGKKLLVHIPNSRIIEIRSAVTDMTQGMEAKHNLNLNSSSKV
jgi:hypothetical protein